jgi:dTDP-4-dehydrorhamnose 3,5-epimerase
MKVIPTEFEDLYVIEPTVFTDPRGFFYESFNDSVLFEHGLRYKFVQDNHSKSTYGVLREGYPGRGDRRGC